MNLRRPNANEALGTVNRSRSVVPMSGICSRCIDGCKGNCDLFKATFRGRELLYPGPFGQITAGADKNYPLDYSHLNIQGYAMGAVGLPKGVEPGPDTAIFPKVDTETEYGVNDKVKLKVPIFTGALGSTDIARKNWDHFAIGAAISGISRVGSVNVFTGTAGVNNGASPPTTRQPTASLPWGLPTPTRHASILLFFTIQLVGQMWGKLD